MKVLTQSVTTPEDLTPEQRWLLVQMIERPDITKLIIDGAHWIFTIGGVAQSHVPNCDIAELAAKGLICARFDVYGNFISWRPTAFAYEFVVNYVSIFASIASAEFSDYEPPLPAPAPGREIPALERIATAMEDIAAGVLAIDAKLQRFIADVDGKDPWQSDAMAGHHE